MKKTILVIGATGAQGGSVANFLLKDGTFQVRCMVRSLSSNSKTSNSDQNTTLCKVVSLFERGAQIVHGNLEDVDSMVRAMDGVYGVFGVTNYWDPLAGYEGEIRQGKNLADACKKANVQHLIYSTLDRNSGVPHFESKVIVEDYIRSLGIPCSFLVTSFYFENFFTFFPPKYDESTQSYCFSLPLGSEVRMPFYSVSDTGGWVLNAFKRFNTREGEDISAVSEYMSCSELVYVFTAVTGKKARFEEIPLDSYRRAGFPGCEELADNFQFYKDLSQCLKPDRRRDLTFSQSVFSEGMDWEDFLVQNKDRF